MAHDRRFRFGLTGAGANTAAEWSDLARQAEALGYSTLFVSDHYVDAPIGPMIGASFAAAATTTLRVGTLVLGNDFKHPAVVAKEAASLDLLSGGRLELGIGAGWLKQDYEVLNLAYDPPGVRVERLAEAIQIIKGAWADGPFSFQGRHYAITEYEGEPPPVQKPHPPLMIGGGRKHILRLAGREADIVGVHANLGAGGLHPGLMKGAMQESFTDKLEWVREGAGERFDDLELQIRVLVASITETSAKSREFAERFGGGSGLSPDEVLEASVLLVGTVDEIVERIQRRRETWGVSYYVVNQDKMESFAPVVAKLAGT